MGKKISVKEACRHERILRLATEAINVSAQDAVRAGLSVDLHVETVSTPGEGTTPIVFCFARVRPSSIDLDSPDVGR